MCMCSLRYLSQLDITCLDSVTMQLRVMVPWMHGFDHSMACQKEFSGLYQVRPVCLQFAPGMRVQGFQGKANKGQF